MPSTSALSAPSAGAHFDKTTIERRELRGRRVAIDIKYCGICHSDVHQARDEWGGSIFPMVPGHEIAGIVTAVGPTSSRFSAGDRVGVGCMVDSCGECEYCLAGEEQFCVKGNVQTYNGREYDGTPTYGGYSRQVVVKDRFVVHIPEEHRAAGRGAAAVCGHHDLRAAASTGSGRGQEGRGRRHGRPRPRRRADRRGDGRRGDSPLPDAHQAGGRPALRRQCTTTPPPIARRSKSSRARST